MTQIDDLKQYHSDEKVLNDRAMKLLEDEERQDRQERLRDKELDSKKEK